LVETFIQLANSNFTHDGNIKAWLYRVATNACYKFFRKHKGEVQFSEEKFQGQVNDPIPDLLKEIKLQQMLAELPEVQRAVLVLKFYDGMSYREIADIMCCPLGTVKSRIHEAIKKLRSMMTKHKDVDE
jgi:RNA polymerase sigma-70 factor (ECF subfamily)